MSSSLLVAPPTFFRALDARPFPFLEAAFLLLATEPDLDGTTGEVDEAEDTADDTADDPLLRPCPLPLDLVVVVLDVAEAEREEEVEALVLAIIEDMEVV